MKPWGDVVAAIQRAYGIGGGPLEHTAVVSPDGLLPLLFALRGYTDLAQTLDATRTASEVIPELGPGEPDQLSAELARWSERLDWYIAAAQTPDTSFDDAGAVLWSVAAPLLAGHYYGQEGDGAVRPPSGWPDDDSMLPPVNGAQPDLRTPFLLMSQLSAVGDYRPRGFLELLEESARESPEVVGRAIGEVVAAAVRAAIETAKSAGLKAWHVVAAVVVGATLWRLTR